MKHLTIVFLIVLISGGCGMFTRKDGSSGDAVIDGFFNETKAVAKSGHDIVAVMRGFRYGVYRFAFDATAAQADRCTEEAGLTASMARDSARLQELDAAAAQKEYDEAVKAAVAAGKKAEDVEKRAVASGDELLAKFVRDELARSAQTSYRGLYEGLWASPTSARAFAGLMTRFQAAMGQLPSAIPGLVQQASALVQKVPSVVAYVPSALKANPMLVAQSATIYRQAKDAGTQLAAMVQDLGTLPSEIEQTVVLAAGLAQGLEYVAVLADPTALPEQRRVGIPAYDALFDKLAALPSEADALRAEVLTNRLFVAELLADPGSFVSRRLWDDGAFRALLPALPAVASVASVDTHSAVSGTVAAGYAEALRAMVDARRAVASNGASLIKAALKGLPKPDAIALRASLAARVSAVQGLTQKVALLSGTVAAVPGEVAALVNGAPAAFSANPMLLVRLPAILIQIEKQAGNVAALTTSVTTLVGDVTGLGTELGGIKL